MVELRLGAALHSRSGCLPRNTPAECNNIIGRNRETNEELATRPVGTRQTLRSGELRAHRFHGPALDAVGRCPAERPLLRGLRESLDRFERVLSRMAGLEDGVVDGLATFTRAVSGATTGVHPCATASSICAPSGSDPFVAAPEPGRKPPLLGPCSTRPRVGRAYVTLARFRAPRPLMKLLAIVINYRTAE